MWSNSLGLFDRGFKFSMFSHRKIDESSCFFRSVLLLGGWLSFEPIFEGLLALELPQRAFLFFGPLVLKRSTDWPCRVRLLLCWVAGGGSTPFFVSVRKMTSKVRIRREKQKSVVLRPNGQFRAFPKPPFWASFSTRALGFRGWALFGVQPEMADFQKWRTS